MTGLNRKFANSPSHRPAPTLHDWSERLLSALLRGESVEWPTRSSEFEENLFAASIFHGITPLLYHKLRRTPSWPNVPGDLRERLHTEARHQAVLELARKDEATRVLNTLATHDIPALILKGGGLAYSHYASPDLRARVDTDVLIRAADLAATLETLAGLGYEFPRALSGISSAVTGTRKHHSIDLHWSISNALIFGRAFAFDELYERSTPIPSLTKDARAPGHVDALIIACIHRAAHLADTVQIDGISYAYGNRLIWLYDIHLLLKGMNTVQWEEFIVLTRQKQLSSFCLDAFKTAQEHFRTHVPYTVIAALDRHQKKERIPLGKLQSHTQFFISDFKVLPTWGERFALLQKRLFPNPAYVRAMYPTARQGSLPLLYLRRGAKRAIELIICR